jgi:hypothetical protein
MAHVVEALHTCELPYACNQDGHRAGHHVVMKATISGVDLFLLAYAWSNKRTAYLVSKCGTTVQSRLLLRKFHAYSLLTSILNCAC